MPQAPPLGNIRGRICPWGAQDWGQGDRKQGPKITLVTSVTVNKSAVKKGRQGYEVQTECQPGAGETYQAGRVGRGPGTLAVPAMEPSLCDPVLPVSIFQSLQPPPQNQQSPGLLSPKVTSQSCDSKAMGQSVKRFLKQPTVRNASHTVILPPQHIYLYKNETEVSPNTICLHCTPPTRLFPTLLYSGPLQILNGRLRPLH